MKTSHVDILREAREHMALVQRMEESTRQESKKCGKFLALEQWNPTVVTTRGDRPTLVIDQLRQNKDQVVNDWRRNRIGIKVSPADAPADDETARIIDGYIRQLEYQSRAHIAYDWALECTVGLNRGFIRLSSKRRKGTFKQDLCIERIPNPDCVYMDPFRKEADLMDNRRTLVTDTLSHEAFKLEWPRAAIQDFTPYTNDATLKDWITKDSVTVAEWWVVEEKPRKIQLLSKPIAVQRGSRVHQMDVVYDTDYGKDTIYGGQLPEGVEVQVNSDGEFMEDDEPERTVWQYMLNGVEVLDKTRWIGSYIPIIPMEGREVFIENKRKLFGLLSGSLDAQQFINYAVSSMAERLQQFPKNPVIGLTGQFKTDEKQWANMNTTMYAFLQADPVQLPDGSFATTLPQRQDFDPRMDQFPMVIAMLRDMIKGTLGMYGSSVGQEDPKAKSGVAIKALQSEGDNATFDFLDNGGRAVELVGIQILDILPKILSGPDIIQIRDDQNQVIRVAVNQDITQMDNPPKDQRRSFDLTQGKYHVMVSAAPSHQSLRQEGQELMAGITEALQDPNDIKKAVVARLRLSDAYGAKELADEIDPPQEGEKLPPQVVQALKIRDKVIETQTKALNELQDEIDSKQKELDASWREACLKAYVDLRKAEIAASKDLDKQDTDIAAAKLEQLSLHAHEVGMAAMQHQQGLEAQEHAHAQGMESQDVAHQQGLETQEQAAELQPEPAGAE